MGLHPKLILSMPTSCLIAPPFESASLSDNVLVEAACSTLALECKALEAAAGRIDQSFARLVRSLLEHPGKVVVSAIGKSGHIGKKIVSTLCSTGTPAVFLHPAEAVHGDLGIYQPGDPTILISKSGTTAELLRLVPLLQEFASPLIALVGNIRSPLALKADFVLDASVSSEADPLGIVPTSSSLVTLALGDALASALMAARNFTEADFARFHPAGQLGRSLLTRVADTMHRLETVATVSPETSLREVVITMTRRPLGAACVLDGAGNLEGLVTDGDIRRALQKYEDIRGLLACDVMTPNPISVKPNLSLSEATRLMEDRPSQISVLPVVAPDGKRCLGLIRIHDIYRPSPT
jgi:arabinose-5-phosphate isomerase